MHHLEKSPFCVLMVHQGNASDLDFIANQMDELDIIYVRIGGMITTPEFEVFIESGCIC